MAWSESKAWKKGTANQRCIRRCWTMRPTAPARNAKRKKVVHPEDMPWELARQGLLKHLMNEAMNTRMETVDAYMQIIPPGSRRASTGSSPRSACTWSRATATTCTRTATWRSPTPITGRRRTR